MCALFVPGKDGESWGNWRVVAGVGIHMHDVSQALSITSALARGTLCLCATRCFHDIRVWFIMDRSLRLLRPTAKARWRCGTGSRFLSVPAAELRFGQPLHETHPHLLKAGEGACPSHVLSDAC